MGWESVTQNTEVRGNTRHEPPPLGECASVLGRYAILCSTAPPPLRLSASRMPASVRTVGDIPIGCVFTLYTHVCFHLLIFPNNVYRESHTTFPVVILCPNRYLSVLIYFYNCFTSILICIDICSLLFSCLNSFFD